MGNIFSNKSFMNRYFSAPKSTGPAKLTDLSGDGKVTQKDVLIGKGVLDAPKQPAKMQEQEGPAKRTRAERQADRDSKKYKGPAKTDPTKKMTKAEIKASIDKQKPIESKKTGKPVKETSEKAIKLALKAKLDKEKPVESKKTGNGPAKKKADELKIKFII